MTQTRRRANKYHRRATKKNKLLKFRRNRRRRSQKGGFISHSAVMNPLYGALWYSPVSISDFISK